MTCEYCDSVLQEIPQNGRCPNCGGRIQKDKTVRFLQPSIGVYVDGSDYLEIQDTAVRIFMQCVFGTLVDTTIQYPNIRAVKFSPTRFLIPGFISVRDKDTVSLKMPNSWGQALSDPSSFVFTSNNATFHQIYLFLKQFEQSS